MANSEETKEVLSLMVTEEQREVIYAMFLHNGWDIDEAGQSGGHISPAASEPNEYQIPHVEGETECPFCLCRPCITNNRFMQAWWEDKTVAPDRRNSKLRKRHYRRFWVMLLHRGVWRDPRYVQRKRAALQEHRNGHVWSGPAGCSHPRDIIPKCVLELVRGWLPNPASQPYMGHRWE